MKFSEYKKTFYEFSAKASDVARYCAFAGMGIVWVFREGQGTSRITTDLIPAAVMFTTGLGLDVLQYFVSAAVWHLFCIYHEKQLDDPSKQDPNLSHSPWLTAPGTCLFYVKMMFVGAGYWYVGKYLWIAWYRIS
jgi:hypothetical protein